MDSYIRKFESVRKAPRKNNKACVCSLQVLLTAWVTEKLAGTCLHITETRLMATVSLNQYKTHTHIDRSINEMFIIFPPVKQRIYLLNYVAREIINSSCK